MTDARFPYFRALRNLDALRLPALRPFYHVKLHLLAFLKAAEAVALNGRMMDENVLTIGAGDETETLAIVEPLDCACFHGLFLVVL